MTRKLNPFAQLVFDNKDASKAKHVSDDPGRDYKQTSSDVPEQTKPSGVSAPSTLRRQSEVALDEARDPIVPGAIDTHAHFVTPQKLQIALASGVTIVTGGGTGPDAADIAAFTGREVQEPIRVYVGRAQAETPQERADIALVELIRQGGFDREVLIVAMAPGTGWLEPRCNGHG